MLLVASALAASPTLTIDLTLPQEAKDAGLSENDLERAMEEAISGELHVVDVESYMRQMANANVISAKGMGVDYGSDMQRFALGGSLGTAVNGAGFAFTAGEGGLPDAGFALQIGAMAGLNLGAFSPKESALRRFKLYVNGMSATTRRDPFDATFLNFGGHLQIKLVKGGDKTDGVRWGGLDLTSGYEFSSYKLSLTQALPVETQDVAWMATGTFDLGAEAQSIPVELSTNLHILVVTVWLGAAFDYNLSGNAEAAIGVGGPITLTFEGKDYDVGDASVTLSQAADAERYNGRLFAGAQADIFFLKLYGQLNVTADKSVGGHVGVRVVL